MSLNPEPSAPEERAEQHLPPKSYADAAEEALESDPQSHANGIDGTMENAGQKIEGSFHEANGNDHGINSASEEDQTSHEGLGQDGTPKSPTAKGHRRMSSRGSHGASTQAQADQPPKEMLESKPNGNGDALTTVKPRQDIELPKEDRRIDLKRRNS